MEKIILIAIAVLASFVFLVSFGTLYAQTHIVEGNACSCTLPIPLLIPTFSSLGILVGSVVYYALTSRMEKIAEKRSGEREALLKLLNEEERFIISKLIENEGKITQSSISRKLGKVKAFRAIERLRARGVVKKERYGKTNILVFTEEFRKAFLT
ncbi:MAG: hypothetical protein J7K98_00120 [Candidatus Aenigmarchaeota archaeon]|nr:hypothetical protein [Candidatus Aenigmarchaeota archaeon]